MLACFKKKKIICQKVPNNLSKKKKEKSSPKKQNKSGKKEFAEQGNTNSVTKKTVAKPKMINKKILNKNYTKDEKNLTSSQNLQKIVTVAGKGNLRARNTTVNYVDENISDSDYESTRFLPTK